MGPKAREMVVVVLHLAFWSQLGVVTRIYLDLLFQGGCTGNFGVCLTSSGSKRGSLGAYFTDLPPNMLGSFLMGLLAASSTLGLNTGKMLAILPAQHPWQAMPELHIGLRTGYCGSLTTFASWVYALLLQLVGGQGWEGGQWAEMLWGLVVGLQLSLASYVFGEQCALVVDRYCIAGGAAETEPKGMLETLASSMDAADKGRLGEPRSADDPELERLGQQLADQGEVVLLLHDLARRQSAQCGVDAERREVLASHLVRLRVAADHHKQAAALAKHAAGADRASDFVAWTSRLGDGLEAPGAPHPSPASIAANQVALRRALSVTVRAVSPGEGAARPAAADPVPDPGPGGLPALQPRWSTGHVPGARAEGAAQSPSERAAGSLHGAADGRSHHAGAHLHRRGSGEAHDNEEVVVTLGELARRRHAGAAQPPLQWQPFLSGARSPGACGDATGATAVPALSDSVRMLMQGSGPPDPGPHLGPAAAGVGASGGSVRALNGTLLRPGPSSGVADPGPRPGHAAVTASSCGSQPGLNGPHADPQRQTLGAERPANDSVSLLVELDSHESGSARDVSTNRESQAGPQEAGQGASKPLHTRSPLMRQLAAFLTGDPERFVLKRRSNLAAAAGLAALTALWVALMVIDAQPDQAARRAQWLALLLGPFGCVLRWLLSQYNYRLPGAARWLPAGTLAANMLGCLTDAVVGVIAVRAGVLGYWPVLVLYAVRTGFAGALSTVSTFVAETRTQLKLVPESLHGYMYSIGSLLAGLLLGVIIYGPAVWAH